MADYGELGYLMAQRRSPQHAGADAIGTMLAGGDPLRRQMIFNQSANQGAQMADRLAQARQRQYDEIEKERQRASRRNLVAKVGETNPLGAQFLDAYENPEQATKAQHDLQESQFAQAAWEARNGDPNALNRMLMVMNGKPIEFQRSLGDGSYTPNAYDTTSAPQLSDVGRAFVGEKKALAGEHNAQAARATAAIGSDKAANYEIVDTPLGKVRVNKLNPNDAQPVMMGDQPVQGKPANPRAFTEHEMAAGLSTPDNPGKIDPLRFRQFEAVKSQVPGAADSDVFAKLRQQDAEDENAASTMGPPKELAGDGGGILSRLFGAAPAPTGKKIVRTGTANGKRVVQYDDGSIEEQ